MGDSRLVARRVAGQPPSIPLVGTARAARTAEPMRVVIGLEVVQQPTEHGLRRPSSPECRGTPDLDFSSVPLWSLTAQLGRTRRLSKTELAQHPPSSVFPASRLQLSSFENSRRMSLPCLAFSREPLCIGAAAGRRPDRSRRSGRDASDPAFRPPGAARKALPRHAPCSVPREGRSRPE